MNQIENQQQILPQKKKWNWKKISVLAGAGALIITSTGLITWAVTKEYLHTKTNNTDGINPIDLPKLAYQTMSPEHFNQVHEKFYAIKNEFIKKLATEQLMFYLSTTIYQELKTDIISTNKKTNSTLNLTPNLSTLLTEKMINSVGSNLRVWGLNSDYAFDPNLVEINFNLANWEIGPDKRDNNKECIQFDLKLGYIDSNETFELKGKLKDSEGITDPIKEFSSKNLAKIFQQANELFNSPSSGLNRQGYFIGLNFNGEKGPNNNEDPEKAFQWKSGQTVNLQEFSNQTWDYILNSLKNYNLVKEDVFVNGLELFNLEGWNPEKLVNGKTGEKITKIKVVNEKNYVWLDQENDFGPHTIVSKIMVTYKANANINFEFTGSYLQSMHWGNY